MHTISLLNAVLWGVQGFLALFFLAASIPKITRRGIERWTGFADLPHAEVTFIGVMEVLGAAGLVLPMATGVFPWLTPLAAIGLAVNVLMATGFHLRADERLQAMETTLWAAIAGLVAVGRWPLATSHVAIPAALIVGALAVLMPAAIINVIILLRRPAKPKAVAYSRAA